MIYLNNAGTTWPKPETVHTAINQFGEYPPDQWLEVFDRGVEKVTTFFGIDNSDRFLFTQSCTQSLTIAFSDFPWEYGDRLIISSMEHHARSRWYFKLQQSRGVEGVVIPRSANGPLDLDKLEEELKKGARMVAMTMASNVTGEILPFEEVIHLAREYGAFCLLDGAQVAGLIPINLSNLGPDLFVFAGHKGPFGPQGIGGLYISERVSMICPSATCEMVPGEKKASIFPTYCDTGSAPMVSIAGLTAGIEWLEERGWDTLVKRREALVKRMRSALSSIRGIEVVGSKSHARFTNAVSIVSDSAPLGEVSKRLWQVGRIKGSLGFQCAPLAHEALGTNESGTLRFSVGPFNTDGQVSTLVDGLKEIAERS